jgi:hypothetical protein
VRKIAYVIEYRPIFNQILRQLDRRFQNLESVVEDAELALLCLDAICCPYIRQDRRRNWLKQLFQDAHLQQPSAADVAAFFSQVSDRNWFVNWKEPDLLNCLERKELKRAY